MAHLRPRHLRPFLDKCLKFSPLVGVVGHRQVGKTTLISDTCKSYYSLDDEDSVANLTESAAEFVREVAGPKPVAIDEAQLMPKLFPALKEWVRKHKAPGQFLLSGSVRFTSLRSIRESLTGRIVTLELLPLTPNETMDLDAPELLLRQHANSKFVESDESAYLSTADQRYRKKQLENYLELGGLPGICFVRNQRLRMARLKTQLDTLLDRDLRLVTSTQLGLGELQNIMKQLAQSQGERLVLSKVSGHRRMNSQSFQNLLEGLKALFLIRSLPIEGDFKGTTLFFEDLAEHQFIHEEQGKAPSKQLHLLFTLVRAAFAYHPEIHPYYFQFRTRGGVLVPVAVKTKDGITGFILIKDGRAPGRIENAAAKAFLSKYSNSKIIFVSHECTTPSLLDERRLSTSFVNLSI